MEDYTAAGPSWPHLLLEHLRRRSARSIQEPFRSGRTPNDYEICSWQFSKSDDIDEIIDEEREDDVIIFDFGCRGGRQWKNALIDNPNLTYIGYKPDGNRALQAEKNLPERATIYTDDIPTHIAADYIVSFSVFEHISDRKAYIQTIERVLNNRAWPI